MLFTNQVVIMQIGLDSCIVARAILDAVFPHNCHKLRIQIAPIKILSQTFADNFGWGANEKLLLNVRKEDCVMKGFLWKISDEVEER